MVRRSTGLDINLRLVGRAAGPPLRELDAVIQSENAGNYVTFVGECDRDGLQSEYGAADLFIFASSCETFGITLLEAMGARLPIACSNKSGLGDILQDAGVYFDPNAPESIAAALEQLLDDAERRRKLGEKAFAYSQSYTWDRCARETFDFIRQVHSIRASSRSCERQADHSDCILQRM